jgi:hypothetical protein
MNSKKVIQEKMGKLKEAYHAICENHETIPLFSRDWWLDAVCGPDNWTVMIVAGKGGVQATLPLYVPVKDKTVVMPPYTQTMGVWYAPESADTKYTSTLDNRQAACVMLVDGLKKYRCFQQNFHHAFTDWLPFYWRGFSQTTRYTYILHDLYDTDQLWEAMSQGTRRNIKKAREQNLLVRRGISIEEFLRVQAKTFERQGLELPVPPHIFRRLVDACQRREQGDLWGVYDEQGRLHAGIFVAWQRTAAYYLAGGGDPELRESGAHSLAMWEAIQYVSDKADVFDFEGSMLPGVERFFREFGGIQTPYFAISRGSVSLLDRIRIRLKQVRLA